MKKLVFLLFCVCSFVNAEEFNTCYIEVGELSNTQEYFLINQIEDKYFVSYIKPSISGRKSFAQSWIGLWNGHEIILNNGYSVYGINKQENNEIYFYMIEDVGEFPGKDFRPITEEDLKKIAEMK